jgi:hypothetical protein
MPPPPPSLDRTLMLDVSNGPKRMKILPLEHSCLCNLLDSDEADGESERQ